MAGAAVAGMVGIIEPVPRPVIGLFRILGKRNEPNALYAPVSCI